MSAAAYPLSRARRLGAALAVTAVLAAGPAYADVRGPDGIADLVDDVVDTVVIISTAQSVKGAQPNAPDRLEPGTPLEEFFDDFFNKQEKGENRSRPTGAGSGFVIDPSGLIVTNNHVIEGSDVIEISFNDGAKLPAEVVGRDKEVDLAVLRVKAPQPLKAVRFGNSDTLRVGQWVLAMGNPFGVGLSATSGIVSGRNRDINSGRFDNFIQTDAAINRGNSGGPLFNLDGEVVGINTAIYSPTGGSVGIGFAVPMATAKPVIEQLISFGETRRGYIGVRIQDLTSDVANALGLPSRRGVLIAGVTVGGPAEQAGLKSGDVILKFDNRDAPDTRTLQRLVADTGVGREADVVVWRDKAETVLRIKVGRLEDATKTAGLDSSTGPESIAPVTVKALGMELAALDPDMRKRFKIADTVEKGVVVVEIEKDAKVAEKNVRPGDVILEVSQQPVASPDELTKRVDSIKASGKQSALFLLANSDGQLRYVTVDLK